MMTRSTVVKVLLWAMLCAFIPVTQAQGDRDMGYVSVKPYLPESWPTDGSMDLRPMIEKALAENTQLFFPGSSDAEKPTIYPISAGLAVPENRRIKFAPNARFLRIPSRGVLVWLGNGAVLDAVVIDGNKYAHWPEFKDLGKTDAGISLRSHNVLRDVVVFNNPGHAFSQWSGTGCYLYRCIAENCGYLDLFYGAMFYSGYWDQASGDGFYINGSYNVIKDCQAYDCQRWAYVTCHASGLSRPASNNTYLDCRGGDVNFLTYGFIDLEGAGENNRFVRCVSPNSYISVSRSDRTELIQCVASAFLGCDDENPDAAETHRHGSRGLRIDGCIATGRSTKDHGFTFAGLRGAMVTNNRIYRTNPYTSYLSPVSSFSVRSIDGPESSIVANNILFEFDDGQTRGSGMQLVNVSDVNNKVVYGKWEPDLVTPRRLRYGWYDYPLIAKRNRERAAERLDIARQSYDADDAAKARDYGWAAGIVDARAVDIKWLPRKAALYVDPEDRGETDGWAKKMPVDIKAMDMDFGEHWSLALPGFRGPGWMYVTFAWPALAEGQELYLYLAAVDSEARAFVDGQLIGELNSGDNSSIHKIGPELLGKPGNHLLALKIWTTARLCGSYGPVGLLIVDR